MTLLALTLWIMNMLVDTGGQLAFKVAAGSSEDLSLAQHWKRIFTRPWVWLGILCYVAEFFVWMAFISEMPLSSAIMLGSIDIVVVMIAGRILFKETFTRWRIAGVLLITCGVATVGFGG